MKTKYLPVDHDYFDMMETEIDKGNVKVVFFTFADEPELDDTSGKVLKIDDIKGEGEYLFFESGSKVRLDRIVVVNGKPGPAYDEYDSFALAPLTCKAGYDDTNC